MVDKQKMTEFFTEKLKETHIPADIQQAILRELASLESDLQTRIFAALDLYQLALTPLDKKRATRTLYYEAKLQYLFITQCNLDDLTISQILSVFSGETVASSQSQ